MNYTDEQTEYMIKKYQEAPERATVEILADEMGKSIKSIIGKLSREGVYRREAYKTKTGEDPVTKVELVNNIADYMGLEPANLEGLEKAPKGVLKLMVKCLEDE